MKYPKFLNKNDEIRIISPSGAINPLLIEGASVQLETWGYRVTEGNFARGVYGRFAGTEQERLSDLQNALDDVHVKAILCSRGGYGLAQIIDKLDFSRFKEHPKWVIGFSDITILHQAINRHGVASLHSPMAKQLTEQTLDTPSVNSLRQMLKGEFPVYTTLPDANNVYGTCSGRLIGGNLSVFLGMRATPYDYRYKGAVLFIEDIGESPYKIDRMMQNLRISGVLSQLSGLLAGQFTDTEEDPDMHATIYQIIARAVKDYGYPVCFNFPAGHIDDNYPLALGANVKMMVDKHGGKIKFRKY